MLRFSTSLHVVLPAAAFKEPPESLTMGVRIQLRQAICKVCGTCHSVRVAEHADGSQVRLDPCPTCGKITGVFLSQTDQEKGIAILVDKS